MPRSISKPTQNGPAAQADGRQVQLKTKSRHSSELSRLGALESQEIIRLEYEQLQVYCEPIQKPKDDFILASLIPQS